LFLLELLACVRQHLSLPLLELASGLLHRALADMRIEPRHLLREMAGLCLHNWQRSSRFRMSSNEGMTEVMEPEATLPATKAGGLSKIAPRCSPAFGGATRIVTSTLSDLVREKIVLGIAGIQFLGSVDQLQHCFQSIVCEDYSTEQSIRSF
jgi:hypothetical protein